MKPSNFPALFLIVILIGTAGCSRQGNQLGRPGAAAAPSVSIQVPVAPENLEFLDFHFTSLNPADPRLKKAVSQAQAIQAALEFEPLGKSASSLSTQVGYFDNIGVNDLQNSRLVWLVTYHGVEIESSGPPRAPHPVAHTLSVAVDAFQGVGIVAMTLAILTPQPEPAITPSPTAR